MIDNKMKIKALKPLNHKGKTVAVGTVIELDEKLAKVLIEKKVALLVKEEPKKQEVQTDTKTKTGDEK